MAKTKGASTETAGTGTQKKAPSKTQMVRQALSKLGRKAKPVAIRAYVLREFGIVMSLNHISNIKSGLSKRKGKPGPQPRAEAENGHPAPHGGGSSGRVSFADIEAAKELAQRVGVAKLHALIDLVAR